MPETTISVRLCVGTHVWMFFQQSCMDVRVGALTNDYNCVFNLQKTWTRQGLVERDVPMRNLAQVKLKINEVLL